MLTQALAYGKGERVAMETQAYERLLGVRANKITRSAYRVAAWPRRWNQARCVLRVADKYYPSISVKVLSVPPLTVPLSLQPTPTHCARTLTRAKWRQWDGARRSRGGNGRKAPKLSGALRGLSSRHLQAKIVKNRW